MGYTVGYGTSFIIPIAAEAKAVQFAGRMPYLAAAVQAGSAVRSSVKGALMGSALWTGARIARLAPDGLDIDLGDITVRRGDGDALEPGRSDIGLGGRERLLISRTAEALQDTSLPAQNRLTDILSTENGREVVAWMSKRIRRDDGSRLKRGLDYIQRTGADGRDLLADLSDTASDRLTRLDPGLQRRVTDAADSMRTERVEGFLEWYDGSSSAVKTRIQSLSQESGSASIRTLSKFISDDRAQFGGPPRRLWDDVVRSSDEVGDIKEWYDAEIGSLAGSARQRAQALADRIDNEIRFYNALDDGVQAKYFSMEEVDGFGSFDRWDDWRENLAEVSRKAETAEIEQYIEHARSAGRADNVQNARTLVDEFADNSDQFRGQSGEAASVMRYANKGDNVVIEPGSGRFDIGINRGDEFVEVKSTTGSIDGRYVLGRIRGVNGKIEGATDISVSGDNTVLEVQIRDSPQSIDEIREAVQDGITQRKQAVGEVSVSEIRVVTNGELLVSTTTR